MTLTLRELNHLCNDEQWETFLQEYGYTKREYKRTPALAIKLGLGDLDRIGIVDIDSYE